MQTLTDSQIFKVARILQNGTYGSFMSAIGCALQLADSENKAKLIQAFGDTFVLIYSNAVKAESI